MIDLDTIDPGEQAVPEIFDASIHARKQGLETAFLGEKRLYLFPKLCLSKLTLTLGDLGSANVATASTNKGDELEAL